MFAFLTAILFLVPELLTSFLGIFGDLFTGLLGG